MNHNPGFEARQRRKDILGAKKQKRIAQSPNLSGSRSGRQRQPLIDVTNLLSQSNECASSTTNSKTPISADHTLQSRISRRLSLRDKQSKENTISSTVGRSSDNIYAKSYPLSTTYSRFDKGKGIAIEEHRYVTKSQFVTPNRLTGLNHSSNRNSSMKFASNVVSPISPLSYGSTLYDPTQSVNKSSYATEARKKRKAILQQKRGTPTNISPTNETIKDAFAQARKHRKAILDAKRSKCRQTSNGNNEHNSKGKRFDYSATRTLDFHAEDDTFNMNHMSRVGISDEYIDDGDPVYPCQSCGAVMWYSETLRGTGKGKTGSYSLCCKGGKISLPIFPQDPPELLMNLYTNNHRKSKHFLDNIRRYNTMFSFTSMGGKVDNKANKGRGPYVYRIQGQNCHRLGGLVPLGKSPPVFSQLYIYDTTNEVENRLNAVSPNDTSSTKKIQPLDKDLIKEIKDLLDHCNPLVNMFRVARDRYERNPTEKFKLKLLGTRQKDGRTYNLPTAPEIAALVPGDIDFAYDKRDIIIESHSGQLQRISELHPQYLALQYPLIFAYAEDGYRVDIYHKNVKDDGTGKAKKVTMREFFAYMIQQRPHLPTLLLKSRKLLQQFLVDAYTMVESERIAYIRFNQGNLRSESYDKLVKAVNEGNAEASYLGQRVILPSFFTGSSRYMMQNYLDAMALCKTFGYPDLFITFTCNPKWPELIRILTDETLSPEDRADYIARMFKIKLDRLIKTFREEQLFGVTEAYVYTIEFQKRGLPHAHICLFLNEKDKLPEPADIDRIISAEIPDPQTEPALYKLVKDFMIHGPCSEANLYSPCMVDKKCSKSFPKPFIETTTVDKDGYPLYQRLDNGRTVTKSNVDLDNSYVVPYNRTLLKRYQAHINVEWCNQYGSIKYLFKYMNKGPDRVTAAVCDEEKDEIQAYFDCRYVSACEAAWRIFGYDIHQRHPAVIRLPFHLENQQNVIFDADTFEDFLLDNPSVNTSKFLEWMECNKIDEEARKLTYVEFPSKFVWNAKLKKWTRRSRGKPIGRIHHCSPSQGDLFYLRILLNHVRGPTSYDDIKTVNGKVYKTCKEACYQLGLLDDDNEYIQCINEASKSASGHFLRTLFVMLLISESLTLPGTVWNKTWNLLSEDILHNERLIHRNPGLELEEDEIKNLALNEIEQLLKRNGRSLTDFDTMPHPDNTLIHFEGNRLVDDETTAYNVRLLRTEHQQLYSSLTDEQQTVYQTIMDAVNRNKGGVFFLYGYGGTGKTFVWKTLAAAIRSKREIVLNVASSGIAALLLEGGRTAHSRFAIPININETSFCCIRPDSDLAGLIRKTKLIIWDEAPMVHKHSFESLDRTFRDILRSSNPNSMNEPFGGKVVVFGGDFRQVLPVLPNASRQDVVMASLKSSYLWQHCTLLKLTKNMRLTVGASTDLEDIRQFAEWILEIGNGTVNEPNDGEATIEIPDDILIQDELTNPIDSIVDSIYPEISTNMSNPSFFQDRAILAPTHEVVDLINENVMSKIDGEEKVYLSSDSICESDNGPDFNQDLYTPDFLNGIKVSGIPNHRLVLKIGVPVMLLRNIDQPGGLCNGTRLKVRKLGDRVIEAEILSGSNVGKITFIPRMKLTPSDRRIPFRFQRRQFPLSVCFAMTINKSQGQTLGQVGLYLKNPVFSHGQLYVALSRVKSKQGLKVMILDKDGKTTSTTKNVVFKEVLSDL